MKHDDQRRKENVQIGAFLGLSGYTYLRNKAIKNVSPNFQTFSSSKSSIFSFLKNQKMPPRLKAAATIMSLTAIGAHHVIDGKETLKKRAQETFHSFAPNIFGK